MKKKNVLLFVVCIFLFVAIIGVIFLGQKNFKSSISSITSTNNSKSFNNSEEENLNSSSNSSNVVPENRFANATLTTTDYGIPVLCYNNEKETSVNLDLFKEHITYLKNNNYYTITLDELYDFLKNNKPLPDKSVVITFNAGTKEVYSKLFPILKELNFTASIFMDTSTLNDPDIYINQSEAKALIDYGFTINARCSNKNDLSKINKENQTKYINTLKSSFEASLGTKSKYLAYYPDKYNDITKKVTESCGYIMCFNMKGGLADRSDNIFNIDRIPVENNTSITDFITKVTKSKK